jgi:rubredoxin
MKCPYCDRGVSKDAFWKSWYCPACGVGKYTAEGEQEPIGLNSGYETRGPVGIWWQFVPKGKLIVRNENPE